MGLDITAYKGLHKIDTPILHENGDVIDNKRQWKPGESMKWSETYFKGRGEGVDADTVYAFEDTFEYRVGGYIIYNHWRDLLEPFKGGIAFQELIEFADNEGVIGPVVSAKLLNDFIIYEEEAKAYAKTLNEEDSRLFM